MVCLLHALTRRRRLGKGLRRVPEKLQLGTSLHMQNVLHCLCQTFIVCPRLALQLPSCYLRFHYNQHQLCNASDIAYFEYTELLLPPYGNVFAVNIILFVNRITPKAFKQVLQHASKLAFQAQYMLQQIRSAVCLFVRLSVRPSHSGIVSKRENAEGCGLHRRVAKCL